MRKIVALICTIFCTVLYAQSEAELDELGASTIATVRQASVPKQKLDEADDGYWEGYLQALVDMNYNEYRVKVIVRDRVVYLSNLPNNRLLANSIIAFLEDFPGVTKVVLVVDDHKPPVKGMETVKQAPPDEVDKPKQRKHVSGIWLPQSNVLFEPLLADPRQVCFSAGYRWHDDVFHSNTVAVSFGDYFPIYRWRDIMHWHGDLQIDIEAAVWAVFTIKSDDVALDNADYYMAIPLTYAYDNWSYRLRIYHESSHVGDEYLLSHPHLVRVNPSREAIDFFTSYQLTNALRFYGGPGWNIHSDQGFHFKPFYVEYGAELRLLGHRDVYNRLYFQPFYAMHFRNWQEYRWEFDITYVIGVEWSKLQGIGRKIRLFAEWHNGFSLDGQFSKMRDDYFSLNLAWGF